MACRCAATPLHCVGASSSLICYVVRRDERHNLRRYRPVCSICDHAVNTVEYRIDNLLAKRLPAFTHMKHIVMLIYLHCKYCILITCYLTEEDKFLLVLLVIVYFVTGKFQVLFLHDNFNSSRPLPIKL